jgi:hypothetical protein
MAATSVIRLSGLYLASHSQVRHKASEANNANITLLRFSLTVISDQFRVEKKQIIRASYYDWKHILSFCTYYIHASDNGTE